MMDNIANELVVVVDETSEKLKTIDNKKASIKPAPNKWSIKEIIGHLVDSANNNLQRFVRAQETDVLTFPKYEQDNWVEAQDYKNSPWPELVDLWRLSNRHLAQVIKRVPHEKLKVQCYITPYEPVTLEFLITDYLEHMKHHLRQVEKQDEL